MSTALDTGRRPRMDPRIARRRVEVRREEGRRRLRILVAGSSAAVLVCLLVGSLWTPLFKVRHVSVSIHGTGTAAVAASGAGASVNAKQIVAAAGLAKEHLMIDVNGRAIERRLDAIPLIGDARVSVDWPGTVRIAVVERRPVAAVAEAGLPGGAPRWAAVDATGRVLSVGASAVPGLPVILGVTGLPAAGGWIPGSAGPSAPPVMASASGAAGTGANPQGAGLVDMNAQSDGTDVPRGIAAALAIAASLPADIRGDVQSITVNTGPPASLTMWVLPAKAASGSIKVVLGDGSQLDAKLTALETLLTQADLTGVAQLDLTVPDRPAALTARPTPGSLSTHAGG